MNWPIIEENKEIALEKGIIDLVRTQSFPKN